MAEFNPAANLLLMLGEWERLEALVQRSIGGNVRLLDNEGNVVVGEEPTLPLCNLIHSTEYGLNSCRKNYAQLCALTPSTEDVNIFCCHAGLSNFYLPLKYEGKILGAIVGGAAFAEKKDIYQALKLLEELHIDTELNKKSVEKIKNMPQDELRGIARIMQNVALPFINNLLRQEHQIQMENHIRSRIYDNAADNVIDKISGVFSPHYLIQRLEQEIARASRYHESLSFLVVEIGNLAAINQEQGYQIGDVILQETANLLQNNTRRSETIARLSGNRFGVILPYTDKEAASLPVQRFKESFESHNYSVDLGQKLEIKIGLSEYQSGGANAQELLTAALANLN
ncbi:MAG: diguanylate cyclase [Candidatus Schekmanbacteria bacterium]|nr:diguanylate cyclase [Candidatus Schekmanbacteria bacterium]